jgi:NADPH:quinone reductase-like Zn-dependent oxidoreductase
MVAMKWSRSARPRPTRRPGEALVRLRAATLNQVDLYMRNSGAGIRHQLPQIMGLDGCGVVEEVDADETRLRPGQRVLVYPGITCARCEFCLAGQPVLCAGMSLLGEHRDGTFAHYLSVPAANLFPAPAGLSDAEAAALGVNHLTAWRMLNTQARLQAHETVLIFGIGGGVSLAALQLARLIGARTVVTSREDASCKALALGATMPSTAGARTWPGPVMALTGGRGVDVVIENVGAAVWDSALRSLVRGGRIVTCGATSGDQPPADLRRVFIRQLQVLGSTLGNPGELAQVLAVRARPAAPGDRPQLPAGAGARGLSHLESGAQFGKIALSLD